MLCAIGCVQPSTQTKAAADRLHALMQEKPEMVSTCAAIFRKTRLKYLYGPHKGPWWRQLMGRVDFSHR
jgi:mannose/cellobiose epimerase-like protein (N-acyl-D-glucosamine 2-epimerase family)